MRVLFPTDGSEQTEASFENFLRIMGRHDDLKITGLVVQHTGMEEADPEIIEEFDEDERDEIFPTKASGQRALDRLHKLAEPYGIEIHGVVEAGNYQKIILRESEKHDLLVMHEISGSNIKDFFSGSKIEKLLRGARSPGVLLVRSDIKVPVAKTPTNTHSQKD